MSGILIRKAVGMMQDNPKKFTKSVIPAILLSLVGMCAALLALFAALSPGMLEKFLEGAETPYAVIEAYDKWYEAITVAAVAGAAIVAVCAIAAIIIGRKSVIAVLCAICISAFSLLVSGAMYFSEDIQELRTRAQDDMAQITEDRLESAEVSFRKGGERSGLPGPYTEGQPAMFTVYSGIGAETDSWWRGYLIPDSLGFTPDEDRMYNENKSVDWNDENAGWYTVTYTTYLHVVISVEPLN